MLPQGGRHGVRGQAADALIEVAALVTDYELNILGDGVDVIIKPPAAALEQMNELVTTMHSNSFSQQIQSHTTRQMRLRPLLAKRIRNRQFKI